jgi:transglutaminase-like putative cysteine protease/Flp pilus assembly protein TadD
LAFVPTPARADSGNPFQRQLEERRERFRRDVGRPQAIAPLLGILDLWELVPDRAQIVAFLDEVQAAPKARPEVRARAAYLESLALDRLGRADEAAKKRAGLGLITQFELAGPFDNEGKAGHAAVYGPEKAAAGGLPIDEKTTWDGKERQVSWRRLPAVSVQGMVPFAAALRPESNVTTYAVVAVKAAWREQAAVRVGSSGAVKVWVNGQKTIDHDAYRPLRIDQDVGAAVLEPGWNRVLVKLSAAESGGLDLFLRITRADGSPLDGLTISTALADLNAAARKGQPARFAPSDLGRDLEAAAKKGGAPALTDWGLYLHFVAPRDPERHDALEALEAAARLQPNAEAWSRVAMVQTDPNDQRRSLELGLQRVGKDARAAAPLETQLGDIDARLRRERRAEERWLKALDDDAGYFPAAIRLAELKADRGLPARAAAEMSELERHLQPPPLKLLRAQANLALRRGRRDEAEKLYQQMTTLEHDDADAWHELFTFARGRGAVDAALGALDRLQKLRPDTLSYALDRADLLDGIGRSDDAHRVLEAALTVAPDDAKLLERDGRLLHRLGREVPALERLRRSLELKPQNPELRAYLAELEARLGPAQAAAAHDLQRVYAEDVKALIQKAPKAKNDGAPARVLLDSAVTRVLQNGLSETYQQRVVQILDERGAREEGDFDLRYTPDTQSVEVRAAKVFKPNGDVLEAVSIDETDASEPWYGLYYDVRAQIIRFSALQPGDVIDIEYTISDVGRRNLFADYYGELHFFQEELPRLESRYVLIAPKTKKLYFNQPKLRDLQREEETRGDETIYRFRAHDIPKVDVEPGMPGYSEVAAYVHVSTYKTWSDVATWYTGLVRGQLEPNGAIQQAVREAVKGIKDERAKIRAIYDLVVKRTRYVGLEFGIHGYQPYRVSQVFARKFGDCKDKASLLVVMLKEAGIDASLVLARTRHGGDLDAEPASLAPFDHAIAWVPKYDLYLDGTAEFSGADELPAQDQDIPVLQVNTGKLVRTPVLQAARNRVVSDWRVALDPAGNAHVEEQMTIAGEAAHEWRSHYQSPGERAERYDQAWNGKHPGAHVEKLEMSLEDLEKPVAVRASVDVPRWARPDENELLVMPALGREADMLRSYARLSTRRHDLVLGYPWIQEEHVTVALEPGWKVTRLPEPRTVTAPFGKFTIVAAQKGDRVEVTATLEVDRHRIAKADYEAFRRFCADVDVAVAQDLVVQRPKREATR